MLSDDGLYQHLISRIDFDSSIRPVLAQLVKACRKMERRVKEYDHAWHRYWGKTASALSVVSDDMKDII